MRKLLELLLAAFRRPGGLRAPLERPWHQWERRGGARQPAACRVCGVRRSPATVWEECPGQELL